MVYILVNSESYYDKASKSISRVNALLGIEKRCKPPVLPVKRNRC